MPGVSAAKRSKRSKTAKDAGAGGDRVVATNRRARHDYEIVDTYEAGLTLLGSEVKSLRAGNVQLQDSYARVEDGELWLHGMHVKPYEFAGKHVPDPDRRRKLLLHRGEIDELIGVTNQSGVTLVPLRVYFKRGLAKVELAVAKGRRSYDKRRAIAERDAAREAERALKDRSWR